MALVDTKTPVRRVGFVTEVEFQGTDDELEMQVTYQTLTGVNGHTFRCTDQGGGQHKEAFLTNTEKNDIDKIDRDALVAHLRLCTLLSRTQVGTREWEDAVKAVTDNQAKWLQTAVGQTRVQNQDLSFVDDTCVNIVFQKGSSSNKVTHLVSYGELHFNGYTPNPETDILMVPGALEKEFGYVHEPPSNPLTLAEKDDICDFLLNEWAPFI